MKSEEIKIRVPASMKVAVGTIAKSRFTSESEIVREALLAYLAAKGITPESLQADSAGVPTPTAVSSPKVESVALDLLQRTASTVCKLRRQPKS